MPIRRIALFLVAAALLLWGFSIARSPYRTALPFGTGDLSSIQARLDKLPKDERALVEGYVRRSRGDVLPASLADPDEPFTARTVGEAIALQRKFLKLMAQQNAAAAARRAQRDEALAPLRDALSLDVVKRETLPRDEAFQSSAGDASSAVKRSLQRSDDSLALVVTYRIENTTQKMIRSFKGSVTIRKTHPDSNELGILATCYFEHDQLMAPQQRIEIRCADRHRAASIDDGLFVNMNSDDFDVDWEPRSIRFDDGRELHFND